MTHTVQTTLGDLIATFYSEFFEMYGDEELASLATATVLTELLQDDGVEQQPLDAAA